MVSVGDYVRASIFSPFIMPLLTQSNSHTPIHPELKWYAYSPRAMCAIRRRKAGSRKPSFRPPTNLYRLASILVSERASWKRSELHLTGTCFRSSPALVEKHVGAGKGL